ncbi:helix-turn-helix domain-containing protein [Dactylosporangium sp. NPDC005572]|uniref:helix-turn-helix transcriptional regulator n=1 Tax=Dactylosporangium sp. NPDC005572 TaxID=3156889 RepID=UPI0033B0C527
MRLGPSGETIDTPRHRALGSASRTAILRLVRATGTGLTAADVVDATSLHPSTVRAHLERLVEAGLLVKARASGGLPGRPAWRYRAAAAEPAPAPYRALAAALLDHLATTGGGVAGAVTAGEAWGRRLAAPADSADPVTTVLGVLRQLGFDPQPVPATGPVPVDGSNPARGPGPDQAPGPDSGEVEVRLHTCPFLELIGQQPDVMCALHAGMIRGVLRAAGAADGQAVLEPFAAPNACVARLRASRRQGDQP